MKLRNKLIPIFSVAAATTVAAPLMSSCGNVELTSMDMIDVLHGYTPSCDRAEGATNLTAKQVKDIYIQDVKANPNVMIQDLAWYESMVLKSRLYNAACGKYGSFMYDLEDLYGLLPTDTDEPFNSFTIIPQVAKFGMSDIKIQDVKLVNPNTEEEETINTISMKFNYEFEYEIVADCCYGVDRYQVNRTAKLALASEYKNIPFDVRWDTEQGTWMVEPTGWHDMTSGDDTKGTTWILTKLTNYSLDFDLKAVFTDVVKDYNGNTDTYTYDESQAGTINSYSSFLAWINGVRSSTPSWEKIVRQYIFNFGSYHLYDVMGPRWSSGNLGYYDNPNFTIDESDSKKCTTILNDQIIYSWSYAESDAGLCPVRNKAQKGASAKLLNSKDLNFDVEEYDKTEGKWKTIGTVALSDYSDIGCGYLVASDCQLFMNFKASFEFSSVEKCKEYIAGCSNNSQFRFIIPANTVFQFETYLLVGKDFVANPISYKLEDSIACFWSAL